MVRSPLVWLGEPDPTKSIDEIRDEDTELTNIREFFELWLAVTDAIAFANGDLALDARIFQPISWNHPSQISGRLIVKPRSVPLFRVSLARQIEDY